MFFYVPPSIPEPEPSLTWTDRGNKDGDDFAIGDFTLDTTYNELDLSAIIGAGVKLVLLHFLIRNTDGYKGLRIRTAGNTKDANIDGQRTHTASESYDESMWVYTDADGVIEYMAEAGNWDIFTCTVRGWFS